MKLKVTTFGLEIIPEGVADEIYLTNFIGVERRRVVKGHMAPIMGTDDIAYLCIPRIDLQDSGDLHTQL